MNVVVAARPTRHSVNLSLLYPFAFVRLARTPLTAPIVLAPAASAQGRTSIAPTADVKRGLGYRRGRQVRRRKGRRSDDLEPHPRKDVVSREGRPGGRVAGKWERRRWRRTDRPTRRQEDAVVAADDDRLLHELLLLAASNPETKLPARIIAMTNKTTT